MGWGKGSTDDQQLAVLPCLVDKLPVVFLILHLHPQLLLRHPPFLRLRLGGYSHRRGSRDAPVPSQRRSKRPTAAREGGASSGK